MMKDGEEMHHVIYKDETCDAIEGFKPCIVYACFCTECESSWQEQGLLFKDRDEAMEWLREQRKD
jgi:hypothetical protein